LWQVKVNCRVNKASQRKVKAKARALMINKSRARTAALQEVVDGLGAEVGDGAATLAWA
jgi:hypothetical protein